MFVTFFLCFYLTTTSSVIGATHQDKFQYPLNCEGRDCVFEFKWVAIDDDAVSFELAAKTLLSTNVWLGIGFSLDNMMGDDSVVICKSSENTTTVESYYTTRKTRPTILDENNLTAGLSSTSVRIDDEYFYCNFTRKISLGQYEFYYDLSANYHLLAAIGPVANNNIAKHTTRVFSADLINFIGKSTDAVTSTIVSFTTTRQVIVENNAPSTADCGTKYECFRDPPNCVDEKCYYIYKWANNDDAVDFVLVANIPSFIATTVWMGIGFSYDKFMGNDSVVLCKYTEDESSVESYFNIVTAYPVEPELVDESNPTLGITNARMVVENNFFTCAFTRKKRLDGYSSFFDLTETKYHLLAAFGNIYRGFLDTHIDRLASDDEYDFTQEPVLVGETTTTTVMGSATTTPSTSSFTSSRATTSEGNQVCGVNVGCFRDPPTCQNTECNFFYKWRKEEESVRFELVSRISNQVSTNAWLAIGFSKDNKMGDDSVVVCKVSSTTESSVESSYNAGKEKPVLADSSNPTLGIEASRVSIENGVFYCNFTRKIALEGTARYFDLNNRYHLLAAYGLVVRNDITLHQRQIATKDVIEFLALTDVSGGAVPRLARAHGSIMIVAWILLATNGIIFARYYKGIFPKTKPCGIQIWFHVHRPALILATVLNLVAFVIILVDLDWKWVNSNKTVELVHSIFGIIVIALAIVQVVLGMIRCDKDSPRRPLFNMVHRSIGMTAFVFAVVAIFLGTLSDRVNLKETGWRILVSWIVWIVFFVLLLEIIEYSNKQEQQAVAKNHVNDIELKSANEKSDKKMKEKKSKKVNTWKNVLLFVHLFISTVIPCLLITYMFA